MTAMNWMGATPTGMRELRGPWWENTTERCRIGRRTARFDTCHWPAPGASLIPIAISRRLQSWQAELLTDAPEPNRGQPLGDKLKPLQVVECEIWSGRKQVETFVGDLDHSQDFVRPVQHRR